MNKFEYKNLTPFKWFVLENFPFIEADFDALTEWQLFCKLGKEINKIIDSQNLVGEQAETLTNAFNNLKNYVDNYFENLDVQDEINNKLNEMAESGELSNIIITYLDNYSDFVFDTLEDMKKSDILSSGNKVKTLGYRQINDNGNGYYLITDENLSDNVDNGSIIQLQNNLFAKLILTNKYVDTKQFGCYGNDTLDDTVNFNNCLQFALKNKLNVHISKGKYLLSNMISVLMDNNTSDDITIFGDSIHECVLHFTSDIGLYIERGTPVLHHFSIKGNNNTVGLKLGTENPANANDSIHWANIYDIKIINTRIGILFGNVFDSIFENIDIYYLFNKVYNYGLKSAEGNKYLGFNNNVFNRIRIEDMSQGTGLALDSYNATTTNIFNNLHIEPRNIKCKFIELKNCNELTFNAFDGILINNSQSPDEYNSSFVFDNCRNIMFNNVETTIRPKKEDKSSLNKMIILKNSINNVVFENGYMELPFTNNAFLNNAINSDEMTSGSLPIFKSIGTGTSDNIVNPNRISMNRFNTALNSQRFDTYYGDDNIIVRGKNLNNDNYSERSKLISLSGFNPIGDNISSGLIPHNTHDFTENGDYYHTIYGRSNFAGVYLLMLEYNNIVNLCIFSCNVPTSHAIKILLNSDNIFTVDKNLNNKFSIYSEGSNIIYRNRLNAPCKMAVYPLYTNII